VLATPSPPALPPPNIKSLNDDFGKAFVGPLAPPTAPPLEAPPPDEVRIVVKGVVYVFANATMRNDNSMALRLVEFSFYVLHKGSLIYTTSTLEGNHHFFIQDDAKFNSIDKTSGAWLPGQVRTFKMPTNQMLECKSISVLASGFTVKQGIGAN
jgi:hypothetical protein